MISAAQAGLRARRRQYEVRSHLLAREEAAEHLAKLVNDRTAQLLQTNKRLRAEMAERQALPLASGNDGWALLVYVGVPVKTPRKSVRGGPICNPPKPSLNSRILVSCNPLLFFTTDIARRTSPSASKYRSMTTVSLR
jgi:hypothetical protein